MPSSAVRYMSQNWLKSRFPYILKLCHWILGHILTSSLNNYFPITKDKLLIYIIIFIQFDIFKHKLRLLWVFFLILIYVLLYVTMAIRVYLSNDICALKKYCIFNIENLKCHEVLLNIKLKYEIWNRKSGSVMYEIKANIILKQG